MLFRISMKAAQYDSIILLQVIMSENEKNKQLVKETWGALSKGDMETFFSYLADDVAWTYKGSHRFARTFHGKEDMTTNLFGPILDVVEPGFKFHIVSLVAEGDRVVLEAKLDAARTKEEYGGRGYPQEYCYVVTIQDGKIKACCGYLDTELVTSVFGPAD